MAVERADLEYFANDIKTALRDTESRLSARIGEVDIRSQQNSIDIAVVRAEQQMVKVDTTSTARNHGAGWGAIGGLALMVAGYVWTWLTGIPVPTTTGK